MRMNISDGISKKLVELEIENRREMLKMYDGILEVLAKFDGKVFSKRVETALKKNVSENIGVKREFNSLIINYYYKNRCINYKEDGKEYESCAYLKDTHGTFVHAICYSSYDDGCMGNKDTIIFDKLKEQIDKAREYMEKSVKEMEIALAKVDETIKEYEELKKKCYDFNHSTNWCISQYYDIKRFENCY